MTQPEAPEAEPRTWWDADRINIIDRRADASVPGGVILTPRNPTLPVPANPGPFSVEIGRRGHLGLAVGAASEPIGVVVTGEGARLKLTGASHDTSDIEIVLHVIGQPAEGDAATLTIDQSGPVKVGKLIITTALVTAESPTPAVELQDASYVCRGFRDMSPGPSAKADGACAIDIDAEYELVAGKASRLTLRGGSNVRDLCSSGDTVIDLAPSISPPGEPVLKVRRNQGHLTVNAENAVVRVAEACDSIEVVGGTVQVLGDARVSELTLTKGAATPTLSLNQRATAEQVRGVARLGECTHARITGAADRPLLIESVARDPHHPSKARWADAIISDVRIPDGLAGVPVLLAARDATIFDPDLRDLIPVEYTFRGWFRRHDRHVESGPSDLIAASSHADLLAEVTAERSTQGSIRTRAAHAAYRMRQLTASSRWERLVLTAYRPFGYAQRPGPPLFLWLALTLAAIPLVAISGRIEPSGSLDWLELAAELVFLPFQFLKLNEGDGAELSKLAPVLLVPLRVALTVPFVFAVLAVRQFVKAGNS